MKKSFYFSLIPVVLVALCTLTKILVIFYLNFYYGGVYRSVIYSKSVVEGFVVAEGPIEVLIDIRKKNFTMFDQLYLIKLSLPGDTGSNTEFLANLSNDSFLFIHEVHDNFCKKFYVGVIGGDSVFKKDIHININYECSLGEDIYHSSKLIEGELKRISILYLQSEYDKILN